MSDYEITKYSMEHTLKDSMNFTKASLALVTDEEMEEYKEEWDTMRGHYSEDLSKVDIIKRRLKADAVFLWGSYEKQDKYLDRNLRTERTSVEKHYDGFPAPAVILDKVTLARTEAEVSGFRKEESGLSTETVSNLNEAIDLLIKNGYVFGKDFNALNATDLAKSLAVEKVSSLSQEQVTSVLETTHTCCKGLDDDKDLFQALLTSGNSYSRVWCDCGDTRLRFGLTLDSQSEFGFTVQATSEDE